jgi:hypothetical protein
MVASGLKAASLGCISLDFRWWSDSTDKKSVEQKKSPEMAFWQSIERAVRIKNAIN